MYRYQIINVQYAYMYYQSGRYTLFGMTVPSEHLWWMGLTARKQLARPPTFLLLRLLRTHRYQFMLYLGILHCIKMLSHSASCRQRIVLLDWASTLFLSAGHTSFRGILERFDYMWNIILPLIDESSWMINGFHVKYCLWELHTESKLTVSQSSLTHFLPGGNTVGLVVSCCCAPSAAFASSAGDIGV